MNAEQYIKSKLDGYFFSLTTTGGPEAVPFVKVLRVPLDHIPEHRATFEYFNDGSEPHHNSVAFTKEQDDQIIALRSEGKRWADICRALHRCIHRTRERYMELCLERGLDPITRIDRPKRPERLSDAVKQQVVLMRESGMSYDRIAEQMGLTRWTVADCVAKMRKNIKRQEQRREQRKAA